MTNAGSGCIFCPVFLQTDPHCSNAPTIIRCSESYLADQRPVGVSGIHWNSATSRSVASTGSRSTSHRHGSFTCDVCGRMFGRKDQWKRHSLTHSGVQPFACSVCFKRYTRKLDMQRHVSRVHLGIRPFICSACDKRFCRKTAGLKHVSKDHPNLVPNLALRVDQDQTGLLTP